MSYRSGSYTHTCTHTRHIFTLFIHAHNTHEQAIHDQEQVNQDQHAHHTHMHEGAIDEQVERAVRARYVIICMFRNRYVIICVFECMSIMYLIQWFLRQVAAAECVFSITASPYFHSTTQYTRIQAAGNRSIKINAPSDGDGNHESDTVTKKRKVKSTKKLIEATVTKQSRMGNWGVQKVAAPSKHW